MCYSVNRSDCLVCCVSDSVSKLFWETIRNIFWVWLLYCCWMLRKCWMWVGMLCWIDRILYSKECVCCACVHLDAPSNGFVSVCVCRKSSHHLRVWELDHMCVLSSCCFFVWFCILRGRARACSCYASYPLVYCVCLPSEWCLWNLYMQCVCWWIW